MRFVYILLGAMAGFLGIAAGTCIHLAMICNMKSFGVSYLETNLFNRRNVGLGIVLSPAFDRELRPNLLKTKRPKMQDKISMKWKYYNK